MTPTVPFESILIKPNSNYSDVIIIFKDNNQTDNYILNNSWYFITDKTVKITDWDIQLKLLSQIYGLLSLNNLSSISADLDYNNIDQFDVIDVIDVIDVAVYYENGFKSCVFNLCLIRKFVKFLFFFFFCYKHKIKLNR